MLVVKNVFRVFFPDTPPYYLVSENFMLKPKSCVVVG